MKEFIEYILQFGNLNQQQIDLISGKSTGLTLKKDEYFSEAGKVSRQVGFVLQGVTRVCYFDNKGDEITKYFIEENNLVVGWDTIVYKIISRTLMQKVERRSPLVSEDATTRYLKFLEIYPTVVNRIPLSYIASYLGITQSSLSRIRKNIS